MNELSGGGDFNVAVCFCFNICTRTDQTCTAHRMMHTSVRFKVPNGDSPPHNARDFLKLKPSVCTLKRQKDSEVPSSLGVGKTRNMTSSTESQTRKDLESGLQKTWTLKVQRVLNSQRFEVLKYEKSATPKDSKS